MKPRFSIHLHALAAPLLWAALFATSVAWAGPGAHGPNGEHLDGPTATGIVTAALPTVEAHSELFEIVGRLADGELTLFVSRYDSNAPVLQADVEVEVGAAKAKASFHADAGDYAVTEAAVLEALRRPGSHTMVFTVVQGETADLLDGTMVTAATASGHDHGHGDEHGHAHVLDSRAVKYAAFAALTAALVALAYVLGRRRTAAAASHGGAR